MTRCSPGRPAARRRARLLAIVLALLAPAPPRAALAQESGASADLYSIELLPAAGIDAGGTARLLPSGSPFGVAVDRDGVHLYDVAFSIQGLPDPASLGPYSVFVAWAATPQLEPVLRLGEVRNGESVAGRVALDRFLLLITAEPHAEVEERGGRLVLRGLSASMRMQPHDLPFLLAGLLEREGAEEQPGHGHAQAHGQGRGHGHGHGEPKAEAEAEAKAEAKAKAGAEGGWRPPPMHPRITMPPALMTLRPSVSPYLPSAEGAVPLARPRELLRLADGDSLDLVAAPVRRRIHGREWTMLGFNGQYPGPLLQVDQGSNVVIRFVNRTDFPTAVHWHGIRLENRFDGVPHVTQEPVPPGADFVYRVTFPDAGIYWYHPHHREDVLQDLGLYGNLLVRSSEADFFAPANREEVLMLDDLLVGEAGPVAYGLEAPTHALMGRFGNVLLVNGEPRWSASARQGEVVRFYLTNVSSTRTYNLSFDGAVRMKVVASDLGRYEREAWVANVTIAPAERYVVDVRFDEPGEVRLVNRVRAIDHVFARFFPEVDTLGVVRVEPEPARPDHGAAFERLRENAEVIAEIDRYRGEFARPVDLELVLSVEAEALPFPIGPLLRFESVYRHPVEWSGTMPEMDWVATGREVRWKLRDPATGRENLDIDWRLRVGDVVKVRLVNDRDALHAMQHPIHVHGQRFLVLSVNGVPNEHLVWKDTVLLPTGFVAEILLEASNPGRWMLHCHIAEHLETGMQMIFEVEG